MAKRDQSLPPPALRTVLHAGDRVRASSAAPPETRDVLSRRHDHHAKGRDEGDGIHRQRRSRGIIYDFLRRRLLCL